MNRLAFKTNLTASRIIPRISEEEEVAKTMGQNVMLNDSLRIRRPASLKRRLNLIMSVFDTILAKKIS